MIVTIEAPRHIMNLIVEKGSIAIDGISLTVADVGSSWFSVSLIPHTAAQTVLLKKHAGDVVNLENDIVGKYVQKLLGAAGANDGAGHAGASADSGAGISLEFLQANGF